MLRFYKELWKLNHSMIMVKGLIEYKKQLKESKLGEYQIWIEYKLIQRWIKEFLNCRKLLNWIIPSSMSEYS